MCLFMDLHRVLEECVRSCLIFLQNFFGLGNQSLFLFLQLFFLKLFGLDAELFNEQQVSVFDFLFLHGQEFLQSYGLPLGSFLQISGHLNQSNLELRGCHFVQIRTHDIHRSKLGEFHVGFLKRRSSALIQLALELLDLGHDLGFVECRCRDHGRSHYNRWLFFNWCFLLFRRLFGHLCRFCGLLFLFFRNGRDGLLDAFNFESCFANNVRNDFVEFFNFLFGHGNLLLGHLGEGLVRGFGRRRLCCRFHFLLELRHRIFGCLHWRWLEFLFHNRLFGRPRFFFEDGCRLVLVSQLVVEKSAVIGGTCTRRQQQEGRYCLHATAGLCLLFDCGLWGRDSGLGLLSLELLGVQSAFFIGCSKGPTGRLGSC
mmetsp:Transcript_18231/g.37590  ORF Transcript_18231/g.37590 Transcript_18231/m.37590 type:complete len:370 (+) Transcript_18231:843-1952(+)